MTYLLDINVLIALFDAAHPHHEPAHRWFAAIGKQSWATCPMTENGFVRIVSNPAYGSIATSPENAALHLRTFCTEPGCIFWPNTLSITEPAIFDLSHLRGHQQVSDLYLAGLALVRGGKLATFDASIPVAALIGGPHNVVELIPTG
ncbi:MAG TPA: TA system VapC family ribonuclease toxin [Pirellulaceae bacterium]